MIELIETLNKYWSLMFGTATIFFTLGALWFKVESSRNGMNKLFLMTEDMIQFKAAQLNQNANTRIELDKVVEQMLSHAKEDTERHTKIEARLDRIYEILTKRIDN